MVRLAYKAPKMEVREYAQFERVFTYCTKGNPNSGCIDMTGSGNDEDKPIDRPPSDTAAFAGGGGLGS